MFLVVFWWTYWVAYTTIDEIKLVSVVALPATLGTDIAVAIWLATPETGAVSPSVIDYQ